jgi:hypothetical protein
MVSTIQRIPVAFLLIGASAGICWGMLERHDAAERAHVHWEESVPRAIAGGIAGALAGWAVAGACTKRPSLAAAATVVTGLSLGAAIAAPLGWIVGDMRQNRVGAMGMAIGAVVGAVIGMVCGVAQSFQEGRREAESERDDYGALNRSLDEPAGESDNAPDRPPVP